MKLKNLSISKQIGLGFLVAVLFLGLSGLVSSMSLRAANDNMESMYRDRIVPLKELKIIADAYAVDVIDAVNKANAGIMSAEDALGAVKNARGVIASHWGTYMQTTLTAQEAAKASEAEARFVEANRALDALETTLGSLSGQVAGQLDAQDGALYASIDPISNVIGELIDIQLVAAQAVMARSTAQFEHAMLITLVLGILAIVISIVVGVVVTRGITRPLGQAVEQAKAVASGDLTTTVEPRSTNELGQLLRAQQEMVEGLAGVVTNVRRNAESVAAASAQIAQGNDDLSQRTMMQSSALEESSASMEEMGSSATQNADNTETASQLTVNASATARQGGDVVSEVVVTMQEINESSTQISDIVAVIEGIAFQTNILALNASVEAARAGEQGRGFAVVASEVRELAQRSSNAAKEIKALIEVSVERVGKGTNLVDDAGRTMGEIVTSIQRVSDIVGEISGASREQSSAIGQVSQAITQLDHTTQQNAALVEESAAAAASLRSQADELVAAVAQFRLSAHDYTGGGTAPSSPSRSNAVRPSTSRASARPAPAHA
ncbi:methyl-accepting chemotaxis protein [Larsenimonas suaedae]|uniref:Methyl-accepting chemotaxis protein n=1 Tax=Larsenimonas suaedae TaxID=1851019 RepID=A0ABU1GRG2_9GAMM|nr:methyl-accepting chemotaxis protein [Larsenimonas suaedae]MCM2972590.1 methyl-accepting chemotaxis protein [Larsenimonas suaedae]MDR5894614.1 methyl-accepting chemotaxis protein [Larsenimonas suaedae]